MPTTSATIVKPLSHGNTILKILPFFLMSQIHFFKSYNVVNHCIKLKFTEITQKSLAWKLICKCSQLVTPQIHLHLPQQVFACSNSRKCLCYHESMYFLNIWVPSHLFDFIHEVMKPLTNHVILQNFATLIFHNF